MKPSRLSSRDVLIILLCTAGFGLCILLFFLDINASFLRLNEQPVGTISFRYNTAQRRFIDRVIWDRLRNNSPVYNGDIIRTANLSEAVITFENGGIVDVLSNTLIQIYSDSIVSRVDFSSGGISVNTSDAGMVISSGDKHLTVDSGAAVQAVFHQDGTLNLMVSEGTAFLDNAAIEAGSGLLFDAAGRTMAIPQAVAISPRPGTRFLSPAEGILVDFIWNKNNYTPEVMTRLEVAYDRSFSRIHFAQDTNADRLGVTLPGGSWFWRLYPVSPDITASVDTRAEIPYSRLAVIHNPVPELISPRHNETFSFRSRPAPLRFQWTSSAQASSYVLEAADNPSLQNSALTLHVQSNTGDVLSVISSALGEGTWYWRVRPVFSRDFAGSPAPSVTQSFTIERGAPLTAPVLTFPADNAIINTGTGGRDIIFSWRREIEAVSYTISIASNSSMSSPVIERTLTGTLYRHSADETALDPGVWYWTVRQTGHDGDVSAASSPRMVSFVQENIVQRQIFPADNYTVAENLLPDMRFTWRTNLNNTRFQLSPDRDFTRLLLDENAPFESYTIRSLHNGVYYWRITGGDGTTLHESSVRSFTVTGSLPPPALNPPANAAEQGGNIIIRQGQPLEFNWQSDSDADYYIFRLYGDGMQSPLTETTVSGTNLAVNMSNYADGSYTWTVQAMVRENITSSRRTGIAASQSINIQNLRPVVLANPRNGLVYAGLNASRNPDTARWSSPDPAVSATFLLARNAGMTDIIYRRTNVSQSFVLPPLTAGNYYWTIQAQNEIGMDISPAAPSFFRVEPIPPLPVPQNRTPANAYTITPAHIMQSRSVDFSWDTVPEANGYILTVFHDDGTQRRTVIQTPVLRETEYTAEDIRLLGRGNFYWHVEAIHVIDSGLIDQRGLLLENNIIVDIPSPQHIRTIDSGPLYGN